MYHKTQFYIWEHRKGLRDDKYKRDKTENHSFLKQKHPDLFNLSVSGNDGQVSWTRTGLNLHLLQVCFSLATFLLEKPAETCTET